MLLAAEDELEVALDSDSERLARVFTGGRAKKKQGPITDAAVLQPLAAAAHLSLNSVTTKTEWEVKDKGDEAKFPPDFVKWVDGKLTAAAAAAAAAPAGD